MPMLDKVENEAVNRVYNFFSKYLEENNIDTKSEKAIILWDFVCKFIQDVDN